MERWRQEEGQERATEVWNRVYICPCVVSRQWQSWTLEESKPRKIDAYGCVSFPSRSAPQLQMIIHIALWTQGNSPVKLITKVVGSQERLAIMVGVMGGAV